MEFAFNIGNVITLITGLIGFSVGYGILQQKINQLIENRDACTKRFESIESNHNTAMRELREEMREVNAKLNQLVGMLTKTVSN